MIVRFEVRFHPVDDIVVRSRRCGVIEVDHLHVAGLIVRRCRGDIGEFVEVIAC